MIEPQSHDRFSKKMDMTPMVDVTFLLLIFFMVTASFTVQKSMELPGNVQDEPNYVRDDLSSPYVAVFVSPFNEYRVRTSDHDWVDAPNRHELRLLLADALNEEAQPDELLVMGHTDCFHDKVIQAMDVGIELEYRIQVVMVDEEF